MYEEFYSVMASPDPNHKFMVWFSEVNAVICFCDTKRDADEIASAMNFAANAFIESVEKEDG